MDHTSDHSGIGIVIVDDDLYLRTDLVREFSKAPDIVIRGTYESGSDAIAALSTTRPDVALVDIMMPGLDGVETTRRLREISPDTRVIALTSVSDLEQAAAMLRAGATGFLPKDTSRSSMLDAIRAARRGNVAVLAGVATSLINTKSATELAATLTPAERRVARLVKLGKTNNEIAEITFTSPSTVKNQLTSAMRKLGAHNRVTLAIKAHEANL